MVRYPFTNNFMKKYFLITILFLISNQITAQSSDLGNWMIYIGNKKLNTKWNLHHEIQYRNYNVAGDLEQLLLRTGIGYNLTANSNFLLGYGYILSENYSTGTTEKTTVNEHRIFQQLITKQQLGKVSLSHRYRFEQRFVEDDFKMRFRYFLSLNVPFASSKFYASAYNEIFLNTASSVFDRNRVYTGVGYHFSKKIRFELGYMNQLFESGSRDQTNIMMFYTF